MRNLKLMEIQALNPISMSKQPRMRRLLSQCLRKEVSRNRRKIATGLASRMPSAATSAERACSYRTAEFMTLEDCVSSCPADGSSHDREQQQQCVCHTGRLLCHSPAGNASPVLQQGA